MLLQQDYEIYFQLYLLLSTKVHPRLHPWARLSGTQRTGTQGMQRNESGRYAWVRGNPIIIRKYEIMTASLLRGDFLFSGDGIVGLS
jgi:hypothetical protein